ncbi:hypothetical protein VTN96DRAFT_6125 [Rasamsonia emersonii]
MQVAEVTPMLPAASLPVPASLAHCGGRCAELVGSAQPGSRYRRQQTEEGARSTSAVTQRRESGVATSGYENRAPTQEKPLRCQLVGSQLTV